MRTIVYVDGFNLYYRTLEKNPDCKWLNIKALAQNLLSKNNEILLINYYTAHISGRNDISAPARQKTYLNALETLPEVQIHYGNFLTSQKYAGIVHPPKFKPESEISKPWPNVVKVYKVEEKGSDVNLASHLVRDACQNRFDVAVIISNDTDLVEPMKIAKNELGKTVGLLSPVNKPNPELQSASTFIRRIRADHLTKSQFPEIVISETKGELSRPKEWM